MSRDYSVYGIITPDFFNYNRWILNIYPHFILEILNTHFIYWFIEYPSVKTLYTLQIIGKILSIFGILGIFPRAVSILLFLLIVHLTGFMQATNSEIDGGTILMITLLIMSLTNNSVFYKFRLKQTYTVNRENRISIFLLFFSVGIFYLMAGLNKLIDVGLHWPFTLNLQNLTHFGMERSVFFSNRFTDFDICQIITTLGYPFSLLSGFVTIFAELFLISILFIPRLRLSLITIIILMHFLVYYTA